MGKKNMSKGYEINQSIFLFSFLLTKKNMNEKEKKTNNPFGKSPLFLFLFLFLFL